MQLSAVVDEFILDGQAAGWSAGTVKMYRWHLARWLSWLAAHEVLTADGLTRLLLRQWSASLVADWAPATRKGAITAVRAFMVWLHAEELVVELASALKLPRVPRAPHRTITAAEVRTLLAAAAEPAEHGLTAAVAQAVCARNRALVALLFDSLLRAFELCALTVADVDLTRGVVNVRHGKGNKARRAPISQEAVDLLRVWLRERPVTACDRLFVGLGGSTPGETLTPSGLRIIVRRLGARAGLAGVSPHAFRRGGATQAVLNGAPDRLVQVWAGWSDGKMLRLYTEALEGSEDALAVHAPFSPLASAVNGGGKGALTSGG